MKYKLLKDLPFAKAGEVFERHTFESRDGLSDYDYFEIRKLEQGETNETAFGIKRNYFIDNFDEWFEEVKEFEEWKPKFDENFRIMNIDSSISDYCAWGNSDRDNFLLSTGNCYHLDTPDELIIKEQKLIPQAMRRLKMASKKAWFEFDGSEGPDWSDGLQEKWKLSYDHSTNIFLSTGSRIEQFGNLPCFPTEESCQAYIDNHKDDLKLLFGVE